MIKNICAIYAIKNIQKNRIYIGSTIHAKDRKQEHYRELRGNKHSNPYLQSDYNKCGENNFYFEILEVVSCKEELCIREQVYIDQYFDGQKDCYNICRISNRPPPMIWTEEMKQKQSERTKGQPIHPKTLERLLNKEKNPFAKAGLDHPKYGKQMPKSAKEAISIALTGKEKSLEHCINISKALTGKSLPVYVKEKFCDGRRKGINNANAKKVEQYSLDGILIKVWDLMIYASKETGTNLASMSSCCSGKNKSANGFIWRKPTKAI